MCENPELGTAWRGRILFQTSIVFTEKPVFQLTDLGQKEIDEAKLYTEGRKFEMIA